MSAWLEKWRNQQAEAISSTALARVAENNLPSSLPPARVPLAAPVAAGDVVDLPRICAVHDRPFTARYVMGNDRRFHHTQAIQVSARLWRGQYAGNGDRVTVDPRDIAEEECPWCGAFGLAVLCGKCRAEVCHGRTAGDYFRCRKSCGGEGRMVPEGRTHEGLRPSLGPSGPRGSY
jgi:hypothetical protein